MACECGVSGMDPGRTHEVPPDGARYITCMAPNVMVHHGSIVGSHGIVAAAAAAFSSCGFVCVCVWAGTTGAAQFCYYYPLAWRTPCSVFLRPRSL